MGRTGAERWNDRGAETKEPDPEVFSVPSVSLWFLGLAGTPRTQIFGTRIVLIIALPLSA